MNGQWVFCLHNSYSLIQILLKLYRCLDHAWKMCMWFKYNTQTIFITRERGGVVVERSIPTSVTVSPCCVLEQGTLTPYSTG